VKVLKEEVYLWSSSSSVSESGESRSASHSEVGRGAGGSRIG
jgi:hypothetical protein